MSTPPTKHTIPMDRHSPKEIAAHLGVSYRMVLNACRDGKLKHYRINARVIWITNSAALAWFESFATGGDST